MIASQLEFHNVAELETVPGIPGLRLQRFNPETRNSFGSPIHDRGRFFAHRSVGCEIRFVTPSKFFRVTLTNLGMDGSLIVYKGDFLHSQHELKNGVMTSIFLEEPPSFSAVQPEVLRGQRFAPQVWRLVFDQNTQAVFHHLDSFGHGTRPPEPSEKPALRWLAYGSSITFGGNALLHSSTYIQHAARLLGVDVSNKGLPGSCQAEQVVARQFAEDEEWDFATFELGVNMVELFTPEEFTEKIIGFLQTIIRQRPGLPLFVLNLYPNRADHALDPTTPAARNNPVYNAIVPSAVAFLGSPDVHFIDGRLVLDQFHGLTTDLVHPSDEGHVRMGANLASLLQPEISRLLAAKSSISDDTAGLA